LSCLGDHGGGSGRLVLPVSRKLSGGTVVTCETVNTRFNENQTELGVLVLAVKGQMLTDGDRLLDKHIKILWDLRGQTVGLENTDDLLSSDRLDLGDTVGVTENDTNLGRGQTLLGKLADLVLNVLGGNLGPRRWCALVRLGTLRDTLSWCMHTTHLELFL
jgi:hypothetical protein